MNIKCGRNESVVAIACFRRPEDEEPFFTIELSPLEAEILIKDLVTLVSSFVAQNKNPVLAVDRWINTHCPKN